MADLERRTSRILGIGELEIQGVKKTYAAIQSGVELLYKPVTDISGLREPLISEVRSNGITPEVIVFKNADHQVERVEMPVLTLPKIK